MSSGFVLSSSMILFCLSSLCFFPVFQAFSQIFVPKNPLNFSFFLFFIRLVLTWLLTSFGPFGPWGRFSIFKGIRPMLQILLFIFLPMAYEAIFWTMSSGCCSLTINEASPAASANHHAGTLLAFNKMCTTASTRCYI